MIAAAILVCLTVSVIDGDTIHCNADTVRIATIDAPELRTSRCDAERRLAEIAKTRLATMLETGRITVAIGDPADGRKRDRYGRTLGIVLANDRDIGAALVAEGLARQWTGRRRPWCE